MENQNFQDNTAAQQRFDSFKFGGGAIGNAPSNRPSSLQHQRSHSRSHSRSHKTFSVPTRPSSSLSLTMNQRDSFKLSGVAKDGVGTSVNANAPPATSRPNSHHRRRSSVSTRRESADLMGVTVPDLSSAKLEDNINLGDKDSIRRRALLALEGKTDLAFAAVEIPDLAPDNVALSFPSQPSFPPGTGMPGLNGLSSKRDSLGKYMNVLPNKDQLDTLVEEDEDEGHEVEELPSCYSEDGVFIDAKVTLSRNRPASLNLRPLALVSGTAASSAWSLPTPTMTPTMSPTPTVSTYSPKTGAQGLRSLSLSLSSPDGTVSSSHVSMTETASIARQARRKSLALSSSPPSHPSLPSGFQLRRLSLSLDTDGVAIFSSGYKSKPKRRSSIQYKKGNDESTSSGECVGLPTPDQTPITSRAASVAKQEPAALTASEQHFLFQSHQTLLTRITDLERVLRTRSKHHPRSVSVSSDYSSQSISEISIGTSELSEETSQLVSDLKEERDELKRDIDGWRVRVADLERQIVILNQRIESERRETWTAWTKLGDIEAERNLLRKNLSQKDMEFRQIRQDCDTLHELLVAEETSRQAAVNEIARLEEELSEQKRLVAQGQILTKLQQQTPAEVDADYDEEIDELVHYEDEDDFDVSFGSIGTTSSGDFASSITRMPMRLPQTPSLDLSEGSRSPSPPHSATATTHTRNVSLSKWVFPSGPATPTRHVSDDTDNFFGIEDVDGSPRANTSSQESQSLFSQSLKWSSVNNDHELPPFVLPAHVGTEVIKRPILNAVIEEADEDEKEETSTELSNEGLLREDFETMDLAGEEHNGIMHFTFTPNISVTVTPPSASTTPKSVAKHPRANTEEDEDLFGDASSWRWLQDDISAETSIFPDDLSFVDGSESVGLGSLPDHSVTKASSPLTKVPPSITITEQTPSMLVKKKTIVTPSMIPKRAAPLASLTRSSSSVKSRIPQRSPTSTSPRLTRNHGLGFTLSR